MTEVKCLSQHLCYPTEVNLDAVYHIFRYLYKNLGKNPCRITYRPMYGLTYENVFDVVGRDLDEWKYFYPDAQKIIPGNILDALGKYVFIKDYVYSNNAGKMKNRRSHFGIIVYVNNAPIIWVSKLQNIVEASIFGSDFVSIRISTEIIEALW